VNWDYIIVGAGSAGCVLANRLTESGRKNVLLIEAGPSDKNIYFRIPKGFGKLLPDPRVMWHFPVKTDGPGQEVWPRGKVLGGSSSVNGMMYVRGHPADYDGWEAAGCNGWGWRNILAAYKAMENHSLGGNAVRGGDGSLRVSARPPETIPICEALIAAGAEAGLPRRDDLNETADEGVGYLPSTIGRGERWSASRAFLDPAKKRRNLRVETNLEVMCVIFDGARATGVEAKRPDGSIESFQSAEIILSAGAIHSPKLLQLSGIGAAAHLRGLGINVVANNPGVGEHMLEHRMLTFQFRIREGGYNARMRGAGLAMTIGQYLATKRGPLSTGAYQVGAFLKTRPNNARPDAQLLMGPYSVDPNGSGLTVEKEPGLRIITFPMRPRSRGRISILSKDPADMPLIEPLYMADPYDREVAAAAAKFARKLAKTRALSNIIVNEQSPGDEVQNDDEIVDAFRTRGGPAMHACSTCRMGVDDMAVIGPDLRVRGVAGLSIVDLSIFPSMVSGNTNGPVMAMAWRAGDVIATREAKA
jgi:choline dehydrogenase-like flavoprotein